MPKEVIQGESSEGVSPDLGIEVLWGRNTFVQLASVNLPMRKVDQYDPNGGWFTDMTRPMVNHLIRVLRRARDQAYGSDE